MGIAAAIALSSPEVVTLLCFLEWLPRMPEIIPCLGCGDLY